jgi:hypothetical protein
MAQEEKGTKRLRGFAAMDAEKQRQIASKGGKIAHQRGNAHEFTPEEAREAARKSGPRDASDPEAQVPLAIEGAPFPLFIRKGDNAPQKVFIAFPKEGPREGGKPAAIAGFWLIKSDETGECEVRYNKGYAAGQPELDAGRIAEGEAWVLAHFNTCLKEWEKENPDQHRRIQGEAAAEAEEASATGKGHAAKVVAARRAVEGGNGPALGGPTDPDRVITRRRVAPKPETEDS